MAALRHGLLFVALLVATEAAEVTPVQKVLAMMGEMKAKAKQEKEAEIAVFNDFMKFCKVTTREKSYAIKDSTAKMGKLAADIEDFDAKAMVLGKEISRLDTAIDETEHEKAVAKETREKAHKDYKATHSDYVAEIEELAIGAEKLKKMMSSTGASAAPAAAVSLIQEMSARPNLPESARKVLVSFLSTGFEAGEPAFESQSDGPLEMMNDLKDKMVDEKTELETEEMNAEHAYELMVAQLQNQIDSDAASRSDKSSTKKQMESDSAAAKGDLADTTHMKTSDEKYVVDLTTLCQEKEEDFTSRQKLRSEELEAISKAMEIIGGQGVSGAAGKHLPSFAQRKPRALAQLRNNNNNNAQRPVQQAAAGFLHAQGRMLNSRALSALAIRVSADPFVKVRKMIQDMLVKLEQEANDEAEHKGWCDTEMSTNQATREAKTTRVEELTANIEELTASSQKLANEIADLNGEITEIDAAVSKATKVRTAEKQKNAVTLADARVAIAAVEQATAVLKDFYAKASTATALVQRKSKGPEDDVPATFDAPFTGSGGEGGVIGMLEVILSDFQRLEADTTQGEAAAAKEFEEFTADSAEDREAKRKSAYHKGNSKSKVEHDTHLAKKDLAVTQKELDASLEYFEKLKPSCVDAGVSYEERVKQREQEIESLQEAVKILEGSA